MFRQQFDGNDPSKWLPADGGWTLHVVSTASGLLTFYLPTD
jgi:hypothetical protein